jgi:hypothetical protein
MTRDYTRGVGVRYRPQKRYRIIKAKRGGRAKGVSGIKALKDW